jgi:hypothetical protein
MNCPDAMIPEQERPKGPALKQNQGNGLHPDGKNRL